MIPSAYLTPSLPDRYDELNENEEQEKPYQRAGDRTFEEDERAARRDEQGLPECPLQNGSHDKV